MVFSAQFDMIPKPELERLLFMMSHIEDRGASLSTLGAHDAPHDHFHASLHILWHQSGSPDAKHHRSWTGLLLPYCWVGRGDPVGCRIHAVGP